jgi:hypothetical protein
MYLQNLHVDIEIRVHVSAFTEVSYFNMFAWLVNQIEMRDSFYSRNK